MKFSTLAALAFSLFLILGRHLRFSLNLCSITSAFSTESLAGREILFKGTKIWQLMLYSVIIVCNHWSRSNTMLNYFRVMFRGSCRFHGFFPFGHCVPLNNFTTRPKFNATLIHPSPVNGTKEVSLVFNTSHARSELAIFLSHSRKLIGNKTGFLGLFSKKFTVVFLNHVHFVSS